ncbi:unnamed protein product [Vicia faba]|uniref:Uncharacterized protein n=1 Tax=Vicia faba TaxID=3906 RepID=A0AAV0ZD09_VICFA|nr:unnamed protein product [Vicia faba]
MNPPFLIINVRNVIHHLHPSNRTMPLLQSPLSFGSAQQSYIRCEMPDTAATHLKIPPPRVIAQPSRSLDVARPGHISVQVHFDVITFCFDHELVVFVCI